MTEHKAMQRAFDTMYRGLAKQGWRQSVDPTSSMTCLYDGGNGLACALGQLGVTGESDEQSQCLGDYLLMSELPEYIRFHLQRGTLVWDLLVESQEAHDGNHAPEAMRDEFHIIAEKYSLSIPEEKTCE